MPQNAIHTGAVDFILSPAEIAFHLQKLLKESFWLAKQRPVEILLDAGELGGVIKTLQKNSGIDFSNYKTATISRRIIRRMGFRSVQSLDQYLELLKGDPEEAKALSQDILIQVTSFFRDPEFHKVLTERIFPKLTSGRATQDPIRIWVPGCASGEEVYSILIALTEHLSNINQPIPVQVFGTDLSEPAIQKARAGVYVQNSVSEISSERIQRFFSREGDKFVISKALRDQCIFARHNVLADPPFAKLDLLSCQNLLIYFDNVLQKRVLSIFNYALKPAGVLYLGKAEAVVSNLNLFTPLFPGSHAYTKNSSRSHLYFDYAGASK